MRYLNSEIKLEIKTLSDTN